MVERSLPTPEIRSSILFIGKFYILGIINFVYKLSWKYENKGKEAGKSPFTYPFLKLTRNVGPEIHWNLRFANGIREKSGWWQIVVWENFVVDILEMPLVTTILFVSSIISTGTVVSLISPCHREDFLGGYYVLTGIGEYCFYWVRFDLLQPLFRLVPRGLTN